MSKPQRQDITAIIYDKRGRVLSVAKNDYLRSHPLQGFHAKKVGQEHRIYLHAEIHAIVKCKDIEKAHRIRVFRFYKDGSEALAKPCDVCMSAIKSTNIKVIEHT